jgi:catechol 2,3-dioxygenase-like lactoylglutathione lyase family enzyme
MDSAKAVAGQAHMTAEDIAAGDRMKPSKMNHIGLIVRDLDVAEAFLHEVFGLELANLEPNPGVRARFYQAGDVTIQIVEDELRLRGAPIARLDHVCMDVDDIDEVMAAAERFGAEFVWDEPLVHAGTCRAQFIKDRGGLGIVFQLNDQRGTSRGRHHTANDQRILSEAMAKGLPQ